MASKPRRESEKQADDELFFLRIAEALPRYQPPVEVLRWGGPRLSSRRGLALRSRPARPRRSPRRWPNGSEPTAVFPGDHGGFMATPQRSQ